MVGTDSRMDCGSDYCRLECKAHSCDDCRLDGVCGERSNLDLADRRSHCRRMWITAVIHFDTEIMAQKEKTRSSGCSGTRSYAPTLYAHRCRHRLRRHGWESVVTCADTRAAKQRDNLPLSRRGGREWSVIRDECRRQRGTRR